jgi:hypothetical protein
MSKKAGIRQRACPIWFKQLPVKLPDKIIIIGVVFLIPGTALAIGAVHPWSYSIAEAIIFGLVAVALAKVWRMKLDLATLRHSHAFSLMVSLALFAGFSPIPAVAAL